MAVSRDPAPAGQAARELIARGLRPRVPPAGDIAEAVGLTALGGLLGGLSWSFVGLGWPAALVGAANGLISGLRRTYHWRSRSGPLAFVLDSTWGAPMTAAAMGAHAVALLRGGGGYVTGLSERANRHVYTGGFRLRRGFVITIGNTVNNAGEAARWSTRRQRLVTDHEDVHVWQGRWFGPCYPVLYVGWTVVAGAAGLLVYLARRRDGSSLFDVVETCGYYLNPFEWWAYSRDGGWPPPAKVPGLGWTKPAVRPFSARRRGRPVPEAAPG